MQSPIVNQFYTDQYTPEYSLKKAFDFLDRKEFNYYMWWFQFIDKEDANLRIGSFRKMTPVWPRIDLNLTVMTYSFDPIERVHLEDAIDQLHDQNIYDFHDALEPRTPPDKGFTNCKLISSTSNVCDPIERYDSFLWILAQGN